VAISCLVALTACSKGQESPDTLAAAAKPATLVGTAPPRVVQATLPGALPKPLDSLSGDELYAFTRQLVFGGGVEKERKCKGSPECKATRKTKVRLDAVDGQDSVSVNGMPNNGVVAIKAINKGKEPDEMYGMKPDKNLEYFLVLLPATDSLGRWRLEELDTTAGSRRHTQVASGTFKPCWHPFVSHKVNRANFYTCNDAHMLTDTVTKSGLALQVDRDAPMWMDCAQGCCLASQP
jgi:stalled ribosome alternative rescue factor ArfA